MLWGESFGSIVMAIYGNVLVKAILGLLAANLISGLALAIKRGEFRLGAAADVMAPTCYYLIGGATVQIVALTVPSEWGGVGEAVASGTWALIGLAIVGKVLANVRALGIEVPVALTDTPKPPTRAAP